MIVLIAGIKRSGSTAQYNMVRLVLQKKYDVSIFGSDYDLGEITLIKKHDYDHWLYENATYIFTTDRADEDIIKSLKKFSGRNRYGLDNMRKHLNAYKKRSIHFEYDDIVNNPKWCIETIANELNINVDVEEIYKEFKSIKPGNEYNPITMLFPNHITSK